MTIKFLFVTNLFLNFIIHVLRSFHLYKFDQGKSLRKKEILHPDKQRKTQQMLIIINNI